jgi:hypothetical protein
LIFDQGSSSDERRQSTHAFILCDIQKITVMSGGQNSRIQKDDVPEFRL